MSVPLVCRSFSAEGVSCTCDFESSISMALSGFAKVGSVSSAFSLISSASSALNSSVRIREEVSVTEKVCKSCASCLSCLSDAVLRRRTPVIIRHAIQTVSRILIPPNKIHLAGGLATACRIRPAVRLCQSSFPANSDPVNGTAPSDPSAS